ncbi:hypothetical protein V6Z11_A11G120200 [Gossypium hirsutum]
MSLRTGVHESFHFVIQQNVKNSKEKQQFGTLYRVHIYIHQLDCSENKLNKGMRLLGVPHAHHMVEINLPIFHSCRRGKTMHRTLKLFHHISRLPPIGALHQSPRGVSGGNYKLGRRNLLTLMEDN